MNTPDVVVHVFTTLAAVIALGTVLGRLCRLVGQPAVIGEIAAGIVLGPSLLGAFWPEASVFLIPAHDADPYGHVSSALNVVAQLGILLYLFLVGLGLNSGALRERAGTVVAVSVTSIVMPFGYGLILSFILFRNGAPPGVSFLPFALFVATALSVTALPVLARILADRGLATSPLGTLGLSCAAANDLLAWCLLAIVAGVSKAEFGGAVRTVAGTMIFVVAMAVVIRPLVVRACRKLDDRSGPLPVATLPLSVVAVLFAGLTTDILGVHSVIGAFLLGAVIPSDSRLARELTAKLSAAVQRIMLPAFFAMLGLQTDLRLLSSPADWFYIVFIAGWTLIGKISGTVIAGRLTGLGRRHAFALGVMMSTGGLMALIVLDLGLRGGVIGPRLYAMMVVAVLITTLTTAPALRFLIPVNARQAPAEP